MDIRAQALLQVSTTKEAINLGIVMMYFNFKLFSRIYFFFMLVGILVVIGTTGYMLIEEWSFLDAFYMTTITMSTVGFSEVNELSDSGRIFTISLIFGSIGTFAYSITSISTYLIGGEYRKQLQAYKTTKKIKGMEGHIIVCGYGRVGRKVVEELMMNNEQIIIIEQDHDIVSELESIPNIALLIGDATEDEILKMARLDHARSLVACLPKDTDNIYVVLAAREINRKVTIVSRASNHGSVGKLKWAGAHHVIMPDSVGGAYMAAIIRNPEIMDFLEVLRVKGERSAYLSTIHADHLPSVYLQKSIEHFCSNAHIPLSIVGVKYPDGDYIVNPDRSLPIISGAILFVLGNTEQIKEFNKTFVE